MIALPAGAPVLHVVVVDVVFAYEIHRRIIAAIAEFSSCLFIAATTADDDVVVIVIVDIVYVICWRRSGGGCRHRGGCRHGRLTAYLMNDGFESSSFDSKV